MDKEQWLTVCHPFLSLIQNALLFFLLLAQKKETKKRAGKSKCSAAFAMAHSQVAELFVFQIKWG